MEPASEGEATEVSEARSFSWRRGKKTPTLGALARSRKTVPETRGKMAARVQRRSAEAFTSVVKHSVPRSTLRSPRLRGGPRGESRVVSRERTRYGCTLIVQVAEVGWTHRASCSPGGCKACWRIRALARRKLEAA